MTDQIAAMRQRMEHYLRLSKLVLDRETATALTDMADELRSQIEQAEAQCSGARRSYLEEAEDCRRQALAYSNGPEAQFLFRVAEAFEDLARDGRGGHRRSGQLA